jgi:REP element-mobilizing transposase RayT
MTQYNNRVELRKIKLEEEQLDKDISFIEFTFRKGKWYKQITGYKSGRRVVEYNDKRKKEKVIYE